MAAHSWTGKHYECQSCATYHTIDQMTAYGARVGVPARTYAEARALLEEALADHPAWHGRYAGSMRDDKHEAYTAIIHGQKPDDVARRYYGNAAYTMKTKSSDPYKTTYHRDHTVTIWDVYAQAWTRTGNPSDQILASLMKEERARVMRHCGVSGDVKPEGAAHA